MIVENMEYTPLYLGRKLFGLYYFSQQGLFNRKFVILSEEKTKDKILQKLTEKGFQDNEEVAIRFSKNNEMNLPFFLGKFSLENIAETIQRERKDYIPFVHGLVKTKFAINLYYNKENMIIEVWPGIGASKKKIFNENPDIIRINTKMTIARYLKNRIVENVEGAEYSAEPFDLELLVNLADKIRKLKSTFDAMLDIANPILCDAYCESLEDMNFTAIQKTKDGERISSEMEIKDFYVVKSLEDLNRYDGSKDLFFDIPLNRDHKNWGEILSILKFFPKIYLKSLTMHLAVVLREFGVQVHKGSTHEDYEIKEITQQ